LRAFGCMSPRRWPSIGSRAAPSGPRITRTPPR
jgi:hypothetical protein